MWREPGVHRGAARGHLPGRRGLPRDLGHHGGPAGAAAAEIFSKWWRNFVPLKPFGLWGFVFPPFFCILLLKVEENLCRLCWRRHGGPPARPRRPGTHLALAVPSLMKSLAWGGEGQLLQAIFLLFLILTIVHIFKENVFENKTPEVYIWDCDKATKDMKPQVSCFKSITPPGDGESLVDLCTDCI